jgi:hypothetical protein
MCFKIAPKGSRDLSEKDPAQLLFYRGTTPERTSSDFRRDHGEAHTRDLSEPIGFDGTAPFASENTA